MLSVTQQGRHLIDPPARAALSRGSGRSRIKVTVAKTPRGRPAGNISQMLDNCREITGGLRYRDGSSAYIDTHFRNSCDLEASVSSRDAPCFMYESRTDLVLLKSLLQAGKIVPVIDRRFRLSEAAEALRYLAEGHVQGKVVLTVSP
jgi:Zinc-binding dehydrogenase